MSERSPFRFEGEPQPITIYALAVHRMLQSGRYSADAPPTFSAADFQSIGLDMLGGCESCSASIAAYNAYPSLTGYWRCEACIDGIGYATVQEANAEIFGDGDVS